MALQTGLEMQQITQMSELLNQNTSFVLIGQILIGTCEAPEIAEQLAMTQRPRTVTARELMMSHRPDVAFIGHIVYIDKMMCRTAAVGYKFIKPIATQPHAAEKGIKIVLSLPPSKKNFPVLTS